MFVCLFTVLRLSCGGRPPTRDGPYATQRQAEAILVRIRRLTPPRRAPGEFGVLGEAPVRLSDVSGSFHAAPAQPEAQALALQETIADRDTKLATIEAKCKAVMKVLAPLVPS